MSEYSNLDENGQPVPPITGTGPIRDVLGPVRAYLANSSGPVPDELFALLDTFLEIDKEITGKPLPLNVDEVTDMFRSLLERSDAFKVVPADEGLKHVDCSADVGDRLDRGFGGRDGVVQVAGDVHIFGDVVTVHCSSPAAGGCGDLSVGERSRGGGESVIPGSGGAA